MVVASARVWILFCGLACLASTGCAAKPLPVAETVEGTLTFGKSPVVGARVQFVPVVEAGVKAPISSATTDEKGFFRLTRDDTGLPGAVVGTHKVVIIPGRSSVSRRSRDEEENDPGSAGPQIPLIYSTIAQTPLEVEVTLNQTNYPLEIRELLGKP
jgi:hypothetical protein